MNDVEQVLSANQQISAEFLHFLTNELINNHVLERKFLIELQTNPDLVKKYEHIDRTWNIKVVSDVLHDLNNYVRVYLHRFKSVMGERIPSLSKQKYLEVDTIVERPTVSLCESQNFLRVIYPFMIQQIKMWGCQVLFAQQINSLIERPKKADTMKSTHLQGSQENIQKKVPFTSKPKQDIINTPVARIDLITLLLGSADCIVASDIIRIMSKFPLAMPLVLCDLQKERYVFMLPLFREVIIKWEAKAGKIHENYLFRSPFKMIMSFRIGCNGKDCPGKSAIINQIMKKDNFFSSRGEPGGKYGKPCTLDGSIEFTWLTEETCGDALWKQVLEPHYGSGDNQLILLANLHGDINDYWHFLNMFELFFPSYLIFVMPVVSDDKVKPVDFLKSAVSQGRLHYIYVDPENHDEEDYEDQCVIKTSWLHSDENLEMLRNSITKAISTASIQDEIDVKLTGTRLVLAESPCTDLSTAVIQFIKENKCQSSKKHLKSVKCSMPKHAKIKTKLTTKLSTLMSIFLQIFRRPHHEINKAILHIETELCFLSDTESLSAREIVQTLKKKRSTLLGLGKQNEEDLKNIDLKITKAMDKVDEIYLGLEHFFRELCDIYQDNLSTAKPNKVLLDLPKYCADLLLAGSAVELLNGDSATLSVEWLFAICKWVDKKRPNLRVFVVSIIGLQSSGKSTLLNALFSCKFSVAVGRCSRGLFMRLAFLRDCLVMEYGFDAFLLIDSEGLGSPEKMNDEKSEQNDQLMATLAMGVSDLTMINVFGESITQVTEIMQIAILAMVRLEKTDMASDILVIQHLQERNELRLSAGKESFCIALNEAFNLAQKHCTDMGALDTACLNNLVRRIQSETFLKQFSPLKDGASVNAPPSEAYHKDVVELYKSILSVSKDLKNKHTILTWSKIVGSYWSCAKEENFALRFKNAKKMIEFIDRERKLASIRDSIEYTFGHHKESYEHLMRRQINDNNYDKKEYLLQVDNGLRDIPMRYPSDMVFVHMHTMQTMLGSNACQFCKNTQTSIDNIYEDVDGTDQEMETHELVKTYIKRVFSNAHDMLSQMFDAMVVENNFSFIMS